MALASRQLFAIKPNLLQPTYQIQKQASRTRKTYFADQNLRSSKMMNKLLGVYEKSKRDILHPTAVVVAKGAPKFLTETKGDSKTIYRRQVVLNKHFMESLSDVLLTEKVGDEIRSHGVQITQVEVCKHYNYLNVFWIAPTRDIYEVGKELSKLTGRLHKSIIEKNFMGRIPMIKFNYDQTTNTVHTVQDIIKKADYGKNFTPADPTKFAPPTQVLTGKPKVELTTTYFKKAIAVFDETRAKINSMEPDVNEYRVPTFDHPADMNLCILGLDYERIMNLVLFSMKRARSEHRGFNPVADPLPPAEWVAPPIFPPDIPEIEENKLSPDERIALMKRFVIENKKKKQRLSREARRAFDDQALAMSEHIDGASKRVHAQYDYEERCDLRAEDEDYEHFDEEKK